MQRLAELCDFVAGLRGMLRASLRIHRRLCIVHLCLALAVCLFFVCLALYLGRESTYFYNEFEKQGRYSGFMTVIDTLLLFGSGLLMIVISRHYRLRALDKRSATAWVLAGLGFMWLALDELAMLHEDITWRLNVLGVQPLFGILPRDIYVFGAYGVAALIIGVRLIPSLKIHKDCLFFLVATFVLYFGSEVVDALPWEKLSPGQQSVLGPLEEILKTLGSWMAFLYGWLVHQDMLLLQKRQVPPYEIDGVERPQCSDNVG